MAVNSVYLRGFVCFTRDEVVGKQNNPRKLAREKKTDMDIVSLSAGLPVWGKNVY